MWSSLLPLTGLAELVEALSFPCDASRQSRVVDQSCTLSSALGRVIARHCAKPAIAVEAGTTRGEFVVAASFRI